MIHIFINYNTKTKLAVDLKYYIQHILIILLIIMSVYLHGETINIFKITVIFLSLQVIMKRKENGREIEFWKHRRLL